MSAGRDAKLAPLPRATPEHIGRYRIIGHLAAGGMAELLLAKLVSLNGFERPVVVKRILPHLARDDEFVNMFLDEARITVGIQHPNVVRVEELGRVDGELFLVMEYLNGETLLGLMRRLAPTGDAIGCALATHIVAEACAGLQAAHDLVGADGQPARLVHRDVSPDNLFITYDGTVKLLDFGIAQAAGRVTKTRTGSLKGKHAYMSPEQCNGRELDPRSDLFALGTVLFEVLTCHRLFKRSTDLLTMRAICEDPIRVPSEIAPVPAALDAICRRALERDPARRYESAKDMRRDLLRVLKSIGSEVPPDEALRQLMERSFADRIEEKAQLLKQVSMGDRVTSIPDAEVRGSELPDLSSASVQRRAGPMRWPIVAAAAALALTGVTTLVIGVRRNRAVSEDPARAVVATASAAQRSVNVIIQIDTNPTDAEIRINGSARGLSPLALEVARGEPLEVVVAKAGYESVSESIRPEENQHLRISMPAHVAPQPSVPARTQPSAPARTKPSARPPGRNDPDKLYRRFQ